MTDIWTDRFDRLSTLESEWKKVISSQGRLLSIPPDTVVFAPGKAAENMIFLLNGTVRIQQTSESGREIVLYRIEAGQSCVMTASCLIGDQNYAAEGIAETELEAAIIPKTTFDELIAKSETFRNFIFSTFSLRMTELMLIINEIAFRKIDLRLAGKLLDLAKTNDEIKTTHQQLAIELGTAREVISRQLQEFQRQNWIEQSRGIVRIINKNALMRLV